MCSLHDTADAPSMASQTSTGVAVQSRGVSVLDCCRCSAAASGQRRRLPRRLRQPPDDDVVIRIRSAEPSAWGEAWRSTAQRLADAAAAAVPKEPGVAADGAAREVGPAAGHAAAAGGGAPPGQRAGHIIPWRSGATSHSGAGARLGRADQRAYALSRSNIHQ